MTGVPMRVLLFAPDPLRDPPSGDTTYGQLLLREPPPGVAYTSYPEALDNGWVTIRGRRPRHGRLRATDAFLLAARGAERVARGRCLYREPTWFISVAPGRFDLIHNHLFSICQIGQRIPCVSSAGYPLSVLYGQREGWSPRRTRFADRAERLLARAFDTHVPGYYAPDSDVMTVYTAAYRDWLCARGQRASGIRVIGQALPALAVEGAPQQPTFGFVGRDFGLKGGPTALDVFARLRHGTPEARLLVVTDFGPAADQAAGLLGVTVLRGLSQGEVVGTVLPQVDVLLAPTHADCGVPYGILEALRAGCGVVVTPNPWLDPRLFMSSAVRAASGTDEMVSSATELMALVLSHRARTRERNQSRFQQLFSLEQLHMGLVAAYEQALSATEVS